jgi:RNA polymerase sigma-70 factor (ECF subfamily)
LQNYAESDRTLIEKTLTKSKDANMAFAELFNRHQDKLNRYLLFKSDHNHDLIKDVMQETFIKAWANLYSLKDPTKFYSWLVNIARNELFDHFRVLKRDKALEAWFEQKDNFYQDTVEQQLDAESAVEQFTVSDKEVILLRVVLELTFEAIAEELNLSLSSVKMKYYRAIADIKSIDELQ